MLSGKIDIAKMLGIVETPAQKAARQLRPAFAPGALEALKVQRSLGRKLDSDDPRVVRLAATQMTSELFFKPLLEEMRKFPIAKGFLEEGRTEAIFHEELDRRVAESVAQSQHGGMVMQIARDLLARKGETAGNASPAGDSAGLLDHLQQQVSPLTAATLRSTPAGLATPP